MNFEFLRNIDGLRKAYKACDNAEKLAITMPDMSITSARKSAEALAKYVYQCAHSEAAYYLTFDSILADPFVKKYLGNISLLNAFHFIRKQGNKAVHSFDEDLDAKSSVHVLERLHFVMGEVAVKTGQIKSYPPFNDDISPDNDAKYEDFDENTLAWDMVSDYIAAKDRAEMFFQEFYDYASPCQVAPGEQDLVEILEFHHAPKNSLTIKQIQEHFVYIAMQAVKYIRGRQTDDVEIKYIAQLTVNGEKGYTTEGLIGFVDALKEGLENPDGFTIVSSYYGPTIAPMNDRAVRKDFFNVIESMGTVEDFTYKSFEYYYSHGEGHCSKFVNGNWIDLKKQYSPDILDLEFEDDWWCWTMNMAVEFDFDKHPDILHALNATVSERLPSEQSEENIAHSEDADEGALVFDIQWPVKKLRIIQNFVDEINRVLRPILPECKGYSECDWFRNSEPLAVATCIWTEKGFQIIGTCY